MTKKVAKKPRFDSGWPELTNQELRILRRVIPQIVKSIFVREEDPVRRSALLCSLEKEMLWAARSARLKLISQRIFSRRGR